MHRDIKPSTCTRPPREAYVRVTVHHRGREIVSGLELRDTDSPDRLYELVASVTRRAAEEVLTPHRSVDDRALGEHLEQRFREGRAYFFEVGAADRYVQIFAPWGLPRAT